MGGCASKSSVLKGDETVLAPPPPPQKDEETVVKEAVVEEVKKEEGAAQADNDSSNTNRSLGNLFKEIEEVKDSAHMLESASPKEVEKRVPEETDVKLVAPEETKLEQINPNIAKPEIKKEEKEEESKSPFVEAPKEEEESREVKINAAVILKAEEKTVISEENKPEVEPISEVQILYQNQLKK